MKWCAISAGLGGTSEIKSVTKMIYKYKCGVASQRILVAENYGPVLFSLLPRYRLLQCERLKLTEIKINRNRSSAWCAQRAMGFSFIAIERIWPFIALAKAIFSRDYLCVD